ncbi:GbsR/MarR family transcriptional regulator [Halalkalibacter alkaliphilus]|uniref:HTH-type transcriptional regulator n=1 Tax=Halalkalibacter alkaliphilus TaxID=2917993 RepID=A0A9X2CT54_9BACI|nr:GbsR/MarR family transcriptional regulator [Halalkalibacter alkaliphilus]MCL7747539.1 GbsR/MarR family transcriptional regulator [Halalkalibacter alkaliphilus]
MNELDKLEQARSRFIDSMAQNMNLYGITPSVGRLYGLLYFSERPMTLDCMKDELGMSKTSMSTSVRQLQELKMVEKVWKKGIRKDLYQSIDDWYETFSDLFSVKWRAGVSLNINSLQKSLEELDELLADEGTSDEVKKEAEVDKEKLLHALEYYDWLNRLIDSIESKEIFEYIPKKKSNI